MTGETFLWAAGMLVAYVGICIAWAEWDRRKDDRDRH
jgi:hypothetical protein